MSAAVLLAAMLLPEGTAVPAERLVATHYFYWYRWPDEHFAVAGNPGSEGHTHRVPEPEKVSYLDPAWHEAQFRAMVRAGIDVALPVYWGAPGVYERPNIRFARAGMPAMVAAAERLQKGGDGVRIGLFYDTTTLLNCVRGAAPHSGRADLTTPDGEALFCRTVIEYFEVVPVGLWARHRGGALVVLYGSDFAAKWPPDLGARLRRAFAARWPGEKVCLVADASWKEIGQDLTTAWGAALHGPQLFPGVAQIGPGYDDSPVPGRTTPVREREDGGFYRHSWQKAVASRPELVLIETWNELHEGTEICETVETGTLYLDLTREWSARFKAAGDPGPPVALRWPEPRLRQDLSWGRDVKGAPAVSWRVHAGLAEESGIRHVGWADGAYVIERDWVRAAARTEGSPPGAYLYFQIADVWRFDMEADFELRVDYEGEGHPGVEFDARGDDRGPVEGAYARAQAINQGSSENGREHFAVFSMPAARFANRQNGGSDFRLVVGAADVRIRGVRLSPIPPPK